MKRYGKGLMPGPVYEATLKDGTTARMSFYSESGKPIDFDRGRRLVAACYGRPRNELGYVTSKGLMRLDEITPTLYRHRCRHGGYNEEREYVPCGHEWTDREMDPLACPKCGGSNLGQGIHTMPDNGANGNVMHLFTYPPAEIIDGYVHLPGQGRVRDPYFSGKPAPAWAGSPVRKGKSGVALIQRVLRQLDKDDTPEARRAAELLRREFWPQLDGAAA